MSEFLSMLVLGVVAIIEIALCGFYIGSAVEYFKTGKYYRFGFVVALAIYTATLFIKLTVR